MNGPEIHWSGPEEERAILSPAGEARRDAMLRTLRHALCVRRRRRRVVAGLALTAPVGALGLTLWVALRDPPRPSRELADTGHQPQVRPGPTDGLEHVSFAIVRADPERTRAMISPSRVLPAEMRLADDDLLILLSETGRSSGLIRAGDRVILTSDLPPPQPEPGPGARGAPTSPAPLTG